MTFLVFVHYRQRGECHNAPENLSHAELLCIMRGQGHTLPGTWQARQTKTFMLRPLAERAQCQGMEDRYFKIWIPSPIPYPGAPRWLPMQPYASAGSKQALTRLHTYHCSTIVYPMWSHPTIFFLASWKKTSVFQSKGCKIWFISLQVPWPLLLPLGVKHSKVHLLSTWVNAVVSGETSQINQYVKSNMSTLVCAIIFNFGIYNMSDF